MPRAAISPRSSVCRPRRTTWNAYLPAREGAPDTPLQVVMEPTGMAWFPIAVFFARHAVPTYLVNSQEVADLRRYYQRHAKSDRIDARVLVRLPVVNPEKLHRLHLSPATTLACQRACKQLVHTG